ncbi:ketosteroid isomerase-related protein [Lysobacter sp. 2RAF19]
MSGAEPATPQARALATLRAYYEALNRPDPDGVVALLTDDVVHDLNQGPREVGKPAFREFLQRMELCYHERLHDFVLLASADGLHGAAEYVVDGEYVADDIGMPPAQNQKYRMPGAAFFAFREGRICRVSDHYNLQEWFSQVAQA